MTMQAQERIAWADIAKAIGIYAIFLGHLEINSDVIQYLFSFHVPLFFFISGYLFDSTRYNSFKSFFFKKFNSLIVPYLFFALSLYAFWLFVVRPLSVKGAALKVHPLQPIIPILYGGGLHYGESVPMNAPLWFLTCLFLAEMIFWFVNKIAKENRGAVFSVLVVFGFVSYIESSLVAIRLPWNIDKAVNLVVFFGAAHACRREIDIFAGYRNGIPKFLLLVVLCAINLLFCFSNGLISYNFNIYDNIAYYYVAAFSGTLFYVGIASCVKAYPVLSYFGRNTIILLGVGSVLFTFTINALCYLIFGMMPDWSTLSIGQGIILAALQIMTIVPVIYVINNWFPFLVGRKSVVQEGPSVVATALQ